MANAANSSNSASEYSLTPVTNFYLDIWVPRNIPTSSSDTLVIIPAQYDQRPDLMSQYAYGTPALWWVFAIRNPDVLIDPINDFIAGLQIYIPANILQQ